MLSQSLDTRHHVCRLAPADDGSVNEDDLQHGVDVLFRVEPEADIQRLDPVRPSCGSRDGIPLLEKGQFQLRLVSICLQMVNSEL